MISQDNLTVATVIASRLHGISPGSDDAESANRRYYNDKSPVLVATVKSPRTRAHVEAPTRVVLASGGAFVSPFSSGEHHPANLERQRERERERGRGREWENGRAFFLIVIFRSINAAGSEPHRARCMNHIRRFCSYVRLSSMIDICPRICPVLPAGARRDPSVSVSARCERNEERGSHSRGQTRASTP